MNCTLFEYPASLALSECAGRTDTLITSDPLPLCLRKPYATLWRSYCPAVHPTTHVASDPHPISSLPPLHLSASLPPTAWSASPLEILHFRTACLVSLRHHVFVHISATYLKECAFVCRPFRGLSAGDNQDRNHTEWGEMYLKIPKQPTSGRGRPTYTLHLELQENWTKTK